MARRTSFVFDKVSATKLAYATCHEFHLQTYLHNLFFRLES